MKITQTMKSKLILTCLSSVLALGLFGAVVPQINATTIFSSGFESGDFSDWSGTKGSPIIVTDPVYQGIHSAQFDAALENANKTFSYKTTAYARCYVRFTSLPSTNGKRHMLFELGASPSASIGSQLELYKNGAGIVVWRLLSYTTVGWEFNEVANPTPTVDTWYSIEIRFSINTVGGSQFWLNDVLKATCSGTTGNNQLTAVLVGTRLLETANTIYIDSVEVATSRIGGEGEETLSATSKGVSTTLKGTSATFFTKWVASGQNLSGYIFGTNNTESWVNETWTAFGVGLLEAWSNVTKTLHSDDSKRIEWEIWANNTLDNWATTSLQSFVTTSPSTGENLVWSAYYETGDFSEWYADGGGYDVDNEPQTINVVDTTRPHSGTYSYHAIVHYKVGTADGAKAFRWAIDQKEFWFQSFVWVDSDAYYYGIINGGTNNLMQTKEDTGAGPRPVICMVLDSKGDYGREITIYGGCGSDIWVSGIRRQNVPTTPIPFPLEQWVNLTYHYKVDNSNGIYEAWQDSTKIFEYFGVDTYSGKGTETMAVGVSNYPHPTANYPQGNPDIDVWFDDIKVSISPFGGVSVVYPSFSNIAYNTTTAGQPCKFSAKASTSIGLSRYIFSHNNTGVWTNETTTYFSGTSAWMNKTLTLNSTIGQIVGYKWYCADLNDNWASTTLGILTLSGTETGYPFFSNVSYNTTLKNSPVRFGVQIGDTVGLAGFIFGWNPSGSWSNNSWVNLGSVTSILVNVNKTLPNVLGATIYFQWYANDTNSQWSKTSIYSFVITQNKWFLGFSHSDVDLIIVDSFITWKLYNGTNLLSYNEGEVTLYDGTFSLQTYYDSLLIKQTSLATDDFGNTTVNIPLQFKQYTLLFFVTNETLISSVYEVNTLTFTVSASSGNTSTTKVYVGAKGNATSVSGATSWSYNDATKILTITKLHASDAIITVSWESLGGVPSGGYSLIILVKSERGVVANAKVSVVNVFDVTVASKFSNKNGQAVFSGLTQDWYDIVVESDVGVGLETVYLDRNKEVTVVVGVVSPWLTIPKSAEEFVTSLGVGSQSVAAFLWANLGAVALAFLGFVSVYYGRSEDDSSIIVVGCVLLVVAVGVYFLPSFL